MTIVNIYIAEDGSKFHTAEECTHYENAIKTEKFRDQIKFFDDNGNPLPLDDDGFRKCYYLQILTKQAAVFVEENFNDYDLPWSGVQPEKGCWFYDDYHDKWIPFEKIFSINKIAEKISKTT